MHRAKLPHRWRHCLDFVEEFAGVDADATFLLLLLLERLQVGWRIFLRGDDCPQYCPEKCRRSDVERQPRG
jgi:hypothetical protein